jgi:hypothetical protein
MKLSRFVQAFLDPACATRTRSYAGNATVEVGQLLVRRLEERRVLAAGLTTMASANDPGEGLLTLAAAPQPLTVQPLVTVPGNQTTNEGSPLVFSAATGRLIRVDDPDIGTGTLVVDVTAFDALGGLPPSMTLANTSGLTSISGNGTNVLRLEGTLPNINAALSFLNFYSPDNGNFDVTVTATDIANAEAGSATFQVQVFNVAPEIVAVSGDENQAEGGIVVGSIQVFDPGTFDSPQVSWVVSYDGLAIAQGTGLSVQFFAAEDGEYRISATAIDKDGGQDFAIGELFVVNVPPTVELTGFIRDGTAHITLVIKDPGREQFMIEVAWTTSGTVTETFVTTSNTLTLTHKYTPEELDLVIGDLSIDVAVRDNAGFNRQTLHFREGASQEVAPAKFTDPPPPSPPERSLAFRPQQNSTAQQIIAADLGGASTRGRHEEAVVQQFVLRVVGPDGEESGDYPLPVEALENLPAFLTAAGVPDGHYRVYLVTGDLGRLVIDAHLRAGRMIDPRDESQPVFDRPPASEDASQLATLPPTAELPATQCTLNGDAELASFSPPDLSTETEDESADEDGRVMLPLLGGAVVTVATAAGFATKRSRTLPARESRQASPRFTKIARLARRLKEFA